MKISVAVVLCLAVVAIVAANQKKSCDDRGGKCKMVSKGDESCLGGVRKLDCPGKRRCCLPQGSLKGIKNTGKKNGKPIRRNGGGSVGRNKDHQKNQKANGGKKKGDGPKTQLEERKVVNKQQGKGPRKYGTGKKPKESGKPQKRPNGGKRPGNGNGDKFTGNGKPKKIKDGRQKLGKGVKRKGTAAGKRNPDGKTPKKKNPANGKRPNGRKGTDGVSTRQNKKCGGTKKKCRKEGGKCQAPSKSCTGKTLTGKTYCKRSCSCCVKSGTVTCKAKRKCTKKSGVCGPSTDTCDGQIVNNGCKGGSSCACCAPKTCKDKKNKCESAGGNCIFTEAECSGQVNTRLCGKFCQCCITIVNTTPMPRPPTTTSAAATTAVPTATAGVTTSAAPNMTTSVLTNTTMHKPTTTTTTHRPTTTTTTHISTTTAGPNTTVSTIPPPTLPLPPPTPAPTTTTTATTTTTTTGTTKCYTSRSICSDCGYAPINVTDFRIVNGTEAEDHEYPYQALVLSFIFGDDRWCAGTILTKNWVLTAAHCIKDYLGNVPEQYDTYIGYGHSNYSKMSMIYGTTLAIHEGYSSEYLDNDIALIKTMFYMHYERDPSRTFQPICLAEESDIPYGGKAVASGWGRTEFGVGDGTVQLHEVALDVLTIEDCLEMIPLPANVTSVVCTNTFFKDVCQGDSGGPLVAQICPNQWVQIGIPSHVFGGCGNNKYPSVHTRVSFYKDWIYKHIGYSPVCSVA